MKIKQTHILMGITMLYYVLIYFSDLMDMGNVFIVGTMVLFLIYNFISNNGQLKLVFTTLHVYIAIFTLYTLASSMWATSSSLTIPKFNALVFILIGMIVVSMDNNDSSARKRLLSCLLYGNYIVVYICIFRFGWSNIIRMISDQEKYASIAINANTLGMCAAYAIVIHFYKIIKEKQRLSISDIVMLPAIVTIVASGSRKAIIIIFAGIMGILLLRNTSKMKTILFRTILILPLVVLLIIGLSKIAIFSSIVERMTDIFNVFSSSANRYNNSAWLRVAYINLGTELFLSHPLFGVGIGNSNYYALQLYDKNHYFHNNFIELLSCGGIVGFIIFYSIFIWMIYNMIKYRQYKDELYDICLVLLVIHFFMGLGLVQYFSKNFYFVLLILWIETKHLKQTAKQNQNSLQENELEIATENNV